LREAESEIVAPCKVKRIGVYGGLKLRSRADPNYDTHTVPQEA